MNSAAVTAFHATSVVTRQVAIDDMQAVIGTSFAETAPYALHIRNLKWDDASLLQLLGEIGAVTASRRNPELIRRIRPMPAETAPRNTLSSRHGLAEFPFHTDGAHWRIPPRYLVLGCADEGETERPTHLLTPLIAEKGSVAASLRRVPWVVNTGRQAFLAPILTSVEGQREIRYDPGCMTATSSAGTATSLAMLRSAAPHTIRWRRGDLLIIANRKCLHARGAATGSGRERTLVRVLVGGQWV
jgi:hypothetical protein